MACKFNLLIRSISLLEQNREALTPWLQEHSYSEVCHLALLPRWVRSGFMITGTLTAHTIASG
jgi:hypothetical protein